MHGTSGLKSVARQRAEYEVERIVLEAACESSKVSDAFLDDENSYTSSDAYDDDNVDKILNDEESKRLDEYISKIPEASDEEDEEMINAIINSIDDEDIDINDLYKIGGEKNE